MAKCAGTHRAERRFAGGGEVKETPEQLIARMQSTYGTPGQQPAPQAIAQPAPAPQPTAAAPAPKPAGIGGLIGIIAGRKEQIDKAASYANGGKIKGPGTPTSDSIPARVRQTGEPIRVSTGERILSAEQDALLQKVARQSGFKSLDAMLEAGTGQPVGPTIKRGVAHAATGYALDPNRDYSIPGDQQAAATQAIANKLPAPVETSPVTNAADKFNAPDFSLIGADPRGYERTRQAVAPTSPTASEASASIASPMRSAVGATIGQKTFGFDYGAKPSDVAPSPVAPGLQERTFQAPQAIASDVTRVGNSFSGKDLKEDPTKPLTSINMAANNESMARANAIRQSMIDGQAVARFDRGADSGVLRDSGLAETNALMDKWGREDAAKSVMSDIIQNPKSAQSLAQVFGASVGSEASRNRDELDRSNHIDANTTAQRGQDTRLQETGMQTDVTARGQDIAAQTAANHLSGSPLDQALKTQQIQTGNQAIANSARHAKMVEQLDATTDPAQRRGIIDALLAEQGKNPGEHRYIKVDGGEYTDPNNPMGKLKAPAGVFDSITQRFIPMAAPAASSYKVGAVHTDANGNKAIYQADGTWKEVP